MHYKTLIAASLMSIALTSTSFAQCVSCAEFPNLDALNNGAPTPASKMTQSGGTTGASTRSAYDARAETTNVRGATHRHYRDAIASIAEDSSRADNLGVSHDILMKSLQDSGYNPANDFSAAGNMKTN